MRVNRKSLNLFADDLPNRFSLLKRLRSAKWTSLRVEKTYEYHAADQFGKEWLGEEKRTFGSKSSKPCYSKVLD